ncbi:MAG TPA: hypothetical protein VLL48_05965, partial [Longimicrobiales bacterium]|nr:hypothetical protein [Longimicrobiales bacterium]
ARGPIPAVAVALTLALAASGPAAAQHGGAGSSDGEGTAGAVLDAVVEADLTGPGASVEAVFRVRLPPGEPEMPVEALRVGAGRVPGLRARVEGRPARLEWTDEAGPRSRGRVRVPDGLPEGRPVEVRLEYRVVGDRAPGGRIRIPVVRVPWPPAAARPGTFTARAILPDTLRVAETFPTVLGSVTSRDGTRLYALDLHVVPSVVSLRVHGASSPTLSFTQAVDGAVGILLALLGFLGWRALRRQTGRAEAEAPELPGRAGGAG